MSLKHWRMINGFGNNYFGWGGEDDELHHRLRLNGLLYGDCYPHCGRNDPKEGKPGQSIKRFWAKSKTWRGFWSRSLALVAMRIAPRPVPA